MTTPELARDAAVQSLARAMMEARLGTPRPPSDNTPQPTNAGTTPLLPSQPATTPAIASPSCKPPVGSESKLEDMLKQMMDTLNRFDNRFDELDNRFDKLDERLDNMIAKMTALDDKLERMLNTPQPTKVTTPPPIFSPRPPRTAPPTFTPTRATTAPPSINAGRVATTKTTLDTPHQPTVYHPYHGVIFTNDSDLPLTRPPPPSWHRALRLPKTTRRRRHRKHRLSLSERGQDNRSAKALMLATTHDNNNVWDATQ